MDSLFQVLVENSSDAIVMLNGDGTVRFASDSINCIPWPNDVPGATSPRTSTAGYRL